MLRPSYAELMDTMSKNSEEDVTSRYTVVIAAAKRARQLIDGDETMAEIKVDSNKPVSIAVEEMKEGKITVVPEGQGTKLKPKKIEFDETEIKKELEQKAVENEITAADTVEESYDELDEVFNDIESDEITEDEE
ncbi:MAG: DNA-directed RNA polymerase subunit omega [Clostridia bacterium]|nr:DNA-directed RNA polymerase subunit omega [Clostridia bacterium]